MPEPVELLNPSAWEIGPIIPGYGNYSKNMPLHPSTYPGGWSIDLPQPSSSQGEVHYVTTTTGPIAKASFVHIKFKIIAAADVKILPVNYPDAQAALTLYFQRAGDNWTGTGKYETYRWWALFKMQRPLAAGEYEIVASLNGNWSAIETTTAQSNPQAFWDAKLNTARIGFTLGGGDGWGHGVYATGPAKLVVTSFHLE